MADLNGGERRACLQPATSVHKVAGKAAYLHDAGEATIFAPLRINDPHQYAHARRLCVWLVQREIFIHQVFCPAWRLQVHVVPGLGLRNDTLEEVRVHGLPHVQDVVVPAIQPVRARTHVVTHQRMRYIPLLVRNSSSTGFTEVPYPGSIVISQRQSGMSLSTPNTDTLPSVALSPSCSASGMFLSDSIE